MRIEYCKVRKEIWRKLIMDIKLMYWIKKFIIFFYGPIDIYIYYKSIVPNELII